jgi:hypothetical protein
MLIRHLSDRLKGREQVISDEQERVTFGRDKSCDVIFPEELTLVGRRHFALIRKASGYWAIDLLGDHYVEIDGIEAQPGQPLPKDAELTLGRRRTGPRLQVLSAPDAFEGQVTAVQEKRTPLSVRLRRAVQAGLALLLAILVGAVGWGYYVRQQESHLDKRMAILWEEQAKLQAEQSKAASERISSDAQRRAERGAFLLMLQSKEGIYEAAATAWPIGPSLLVTNAHLVKLRDKILEAGGKMFVKAPGPNGSTFEVIGHEPHPGALAFPEFVKSKDVWVGAGPESKPLYVLPVYDVALLRISGEVSPDAILKIASSEELKALAPGTPLVMAGYPLENVLGKELQSIAAQPKTHFGNVSATTDFFDLPTDNVDQRRLVHHTIAATGGSSGSAIIGPSGNVVAVMNAANFLNILKPNCDEEDCWQRVPNAALVNYAQRADIVSDLAEGRTTAALANDRAYWERQIALFKSGADVVFPEILDEIKPVANAIPTLVSEEKATLGEANRIDDPTSGKQHRVQQHKISIEPGVPTTVVVYAGQTAVNLSYVDQDGKQTEPEQAEDTPWPHLSFSKDKGENGYVAVDGPNQDTPYIIRVYTWKKP